MFLIFVLFQAASPFPAAFQYSRLDKSSSQYTA